MPTQPPPLNSYHTWTPSQTDSSGSSSSSPNVGDTPNHKATKATASSSNSKSKPNFLSSSSRSKSAMSGAAPNFLSSSSRSKSSMSGSSSSRRPKLKSHRSHRMVCHECGTTDTPQWRTGLDGPGTLCNFCGLMFAKRTQKHVARLNC